MSNQPARDGETLSDERRIDELLREFQMACEDAAEFNADSIRASAKHRAILRNELRSELLAVAALRAEVAALRKEGKRCVTTFDRRAAPAARRPTMAEQRISPTCKYAEEWDRENKTIARFCGKPTRYWYRAMGGGTMALCEQHGAHLRPHVRDYPEDANV